MGKYKVIGLGLNRSYRDDLNWNFNEIGNDMTSLSMGLNGNSEDIMKMGEEIQEALKPISYQKMDDSVTTDLINLGAKDVNLVDINSITKGTSGSVSLIKNTLSAPFTSSLVENILRLTVLQEPVRQSNVPLSQRLIQKLAKTRNQLQAFGLTSKISMQLVYFSLGSLS
ncbi:hypothetical protein CBR56_28930 [Bacillus thuringiensis]|uniref:hypothetical protein n=1 Tax=Bacillus cereus group TaxID=86661 RepID=UPI000B4404EA|nr:MULTISPECIES: hypothetical protein [Bacillus cereus group]OTX80655.1 hypothetical protein BK728_18265 [Bacillus thuringiensis serovar chanpaisis]MED3036996.1 hypothetical protein [Bacillus tropicus]PNK22603.1 hypothetical protein CBR56_28930 [Bacillus thuringiensis]PNK23247.1 hypothetical protein CBP87_29180 [Bacillus thuringiensis]PNK25874.1 hypothetical protein CBR55_31965 [Bacillus thuringiensis]